MNTKILIIVPNYWGKGETVKAAWKQVREAGGHTRSDYQKSGSWIQYVVHPDSSCDDFGNITHPKGHPPQKVDAGRGVKGA